MRYIQKIIICITIIALFAGLSFVQVYASTEKACSCCDNGCQSTKQCQQTSDACLCSYAAPLQVYLIKTGILPKFILTGFLSQRPHFTYFYLSTEDIFHPPKVKLS